MGIGGKLLVRDPPAWQVEIKTSPALLSVVLLLRIVTYITTL